MSEEEKIEEEFLVIDDLKPKVRINIKLGVLRTLAKVALGELIGGFAAWMADKYMKKRLASKVTERFKEYFEDVEPGSPKDLETEKKAEAVFLSNENLYIVYKTGMFKKKKKAIALPVDAIKAFEKKGLFGKFLRLYFEIPYEEKGKKKTVKMEVFLKSKKLDDYLRELGRLKAPTPTTPTTTE